MSGPDRLGAAAPFDDPGRAEPGGAVAALSPDPSPIGRASVFRVKAWMVSIPCFPG